MGERDAPSGTLVGGVRRACDRTAPDVRRLVHSLRAAPYAATMKTGVPTSTRSKSHSASHTRMRMHPCEAE
jgi:hypothetical protein